MSQTDNVKRFVELNKTSPVLSGSADRGGGGSYRLASGYWFSFTLDEARSMPMPKWPWDFPDYVNTREDGEFGDGATVLRDPDYDELTTTELKDQAERDEADIG